MNESQTNLTKALHRTAAPPMSWALFLLQAKVKEKLK